MTDDQIPNIDPVHEPQPVIKARKRHKRILVVGGELDQSVRLANSLEKQGFTATASGPGEDAFQAARTELPDLLVIDDCSNNAGLMLARRLFDDKDAYRIPVIMLGSDPKAGAVRQSRAAGCCYYIQQPYDPNVLLLALEAALQT